MTTPDIESRIAKLLAKAEGTTNAHEAEAFMAKAEELMLKFGVERANLAAKGPGTKREEIVTTHITIRNGHGYAAAMTAIAHAVGPSFSIHTYQSILRDGGRIVWLVGHKSDVEQVETLVNSLIAQSRTQALHWWKTVGKTEHPWYTDNQAHLARREFIFSFASGVRSRLSETRNRVVEESTPGTELVLVERSKLVDEWVKENMKIGEARKTQRKQGSYSAALAGFQSGRDSIGGKQLDS